MLLRDPNKSSSDNLRRFTNGKGKNKEEDSSSKASR